MKVLLFLTAILHFCSSSHDLAIGIFHIYEKDQNLILEITLDANDLASELNMNTNEFKLKQIESYIDNQTSIKMDQAVITYKANEFIILDDHIHIYGSLYGQQSNFQKIRIRNTVLNTIENQSNIIQVDLKDTSRDFRMHSGRKQIEIKYN